MLKELEKNLKILAEATRLKIIKLLSFKEMCVCELESVLKIRQPRISQHLRVLRDYGLVSERKEGLWVFYSLNKNKLKKTIGELNTFFDKNIKEISEFKKEYENLRKISADKKVIKCKGKI